MSEEALTEAEADAALRSAIATCANRDDLHAVFGKLVHIAACAEESGDMPTKDQASELQKAVNDRSGVLHREWFADPRPRYHGMLPDEPQPVSTLAEMLAVLEMAFGGRWDQSRPMPVKRLIFRRDRLLEAIQDAAQPTDYKTVREARNQRLGKMLADVRELTEDQARALSELVRLVGRVVPHKSGRKDEAELQHIAVQIFRVFKKCYPEKESDEAIFGEMARQLGTDEEGSILIIDRPHQKKYYSFYSMKKIIATARREEKKLSR